MLFGQAKIGSVELANKLVARVLEEMRGSGPPLSGNRTAWTGAVMRVLEKSGHESA